ncbi:MAG: hypothetical protein RI897_3526 [Verrucomicrobiota bacterium]
MIVRQVWGILLAWLFLVGGVFAQSHTQVSLVFSHGEVRPGDTLQVGVFLRMDPGWHTYWVNPGEAGGATEVEWDLPDGVSIGELRWPVPEVYELEGIYNYVYHGEVMLVADVRVEAGVGAGVKEVRAKVEWLECAKICVPGDTAVVGQFTVGATAKESGDVDLFRRLGSLIPGEGEPVGLTSRWELGEQEDERRLVVEWEGGGQEADVLGMPGKGYEVKVPTEREMQGGRVRLTKRVYLWDGGWPTEIGAVLVLGRAPLEAYQVVLRPGVSGGGAVGAETVVGELGLAGVKGSGGGLLWMLFLGLVGGLILNVMPCVLPVIALKVLGFVRQARDDPGTVRRHGLLYGAGVMTSFAVLAVVVIGVQRAGQLASWGMQFQSPVFLLAMTVLILLVALNLFGLFEVTLGGRAMGSAVAMASKEGAAGAFFNGVLATTLATPCTAPFLGTAVGYAFTQPAGVILLFFLVIGAGLALPYVVISFVPGLGRWMPKPGAWMERFKVLMGFPMLGAAVWLLSLLARHYGTAGVLWVGVFLVIVSMGAWVWGEWGQREARPIVAGAIVLGLLVAGYWGVLERQLSWRDAASRGGGEEAVLQHGEDGIPWRAWSAAAVEKARGDGQVVLVDFTADWCATCQVNKKTSLEIESVREKIREAGVVPLLGDYTLKDRAITEELRRFGRAGVPLVLVYPADQAAEPLVLPELLTPSIVLESLERALR